jgi:membrane-bound lytic murein transglycosylase D
MNKTWITLSLILFLVVNGPANAFSGSKHKGKGRHVKSSHPKSYNDTKSDSIYKSKLQALPFECEMFYNASVRKYIELYTVRAKRGTERTLGYGSFYFPIIDSIFQAYGVPKEMKYIAIIESSLNPRAVSKGVAGMWQFTKGTGQKFGLTINGIVDERRSIVESTIAVAKYLKLLNEMYDDWLLVLSAYNCGSGRLNYAIRQAGSRDFWKVYRYLPSVTRNFVPAFMGIAYAFNYYPEYDIKPTPCGLPSAIDTVTISRRLRLQQVAAILKADLNTLRNINPQYLQGIIPGSESKTYALYIPSEYKEKFIQCQDSVYTYSVTAGTVTDQNVSLSNAPSNVSGKVIHKVRPGESLSLIAKRNKVTVNNIKRWNHLSSDKIKPGQRLVLFK